MAFRVSEAKMKEAKSIDLGNPPVEQFGHEEFPRMVYKHPKQPFREEQHVNPINGHQSKLVLANEHLTKVVNNDKELAAALKDGWVKNPYIPQAPPEPESELY